MQRQDRALRRREIAAALDRRVGRTISTIACLIAACRSGLTTSNRRRRTTSIEPASSSFRLLGGKIVALADA